MRRPRRNLGGLREAKVTIAAFKGDQTLASLSERFDVQPNQITQWKAELLQRAAEVFATVAEKREAGPDLKTPHAKIGQLVLENDFVVRRARSYQRCERKAMNDVPHKLVLANQARLLELARSTV